MKTKKQKILIKELREFVNVHDLVDFGHLSHEDDIEPLKGLSLVNDRKDLYYAYGNAKGHDISVLAREFSLKSNVNTEFTTHLWAILRIKLDVKDLPRILIDAHQAGNDIYTHYHHVTAQLKNIDNIIENESFKNNFHAFTELNRILDFNDYITDTLMQNMYMYFQGISVEIHDSHIYVFSDESILTQKKLDKMLDALMYLTEHIEYADASLHRHKAVPLSASFA